MIDLKNIYKKLKNDDEILIRYIGHIEETKLETLFKEIENKTKKFPRTLQRKIFIISVELLQNVYHHALKIRKNKTESNDCIFFIAFSKQKQQVKLISGNFVNKKKLNTIVSRIEQLNLLSEKELRKLYKDILKNKEFSEKGGGGLGIIDIKRKAQLPIKYKHINLSKNLYFFNFFVFLKNKI